MTHNTTSQRKHQIAPLKGFWLILFLLIFWSGVLASAQDKVSVLYFKPNDADGLLSSVGISAFTSGFECALKNSMVELIDVGLSGSPYTESTITDAISDNPTAVAMVMMTGNQLTSLASSSPGVNESKMVNFGPMISGESQRVWNSVSYFTRADEMVEAVLALTYAVSVLRVRRVCVYYSGENGGSADYWKQVTFLSDYASKIGFSFEAQGLESKALFTYAYSESSFTTAFVANNPQALIMMQTDGNSETFVTQYLSTDSLGNLVTIVGSFAFSNVLTYYTSALSSGSTTQRLLFTSTNALATETSFKYITRFQADWNANSGTPFVNDTDYSVQMLSVSGWINGMMLLNALDNDDARENAESFHNSLFGMGGAPQGWIIGDDLRIGGYSPGCSSSSETISGCNCNQGGRQVRLYEVPLPQADGDRAASNISSFVYSETLCYLKNVNIPIPIFITLMNYSTGEMSQLGVDADFVRRAATSMNIPSSWNSSRIDFSTNYITFDDPSTAGNLFNNSAQSSGFAYDSNIQVIVGASDLSVRNGMNNYLLLNVFNSSLDGTSGEDDLPYSLYVSPSLQDTFNSVIPLLSGPPDTQGAGGTYCVDMKFLFLNPSQQLTNMEEQARKLSNCSSPDSRKVQSLLDINLLTDLSAALYDDGPTLVVGAVPGKQMAEQFYDHLVNNPEAFIVLPWNDFALMYQELCTVFNNTGAVYMNRVLTLTNLPLWSDVSASAESQSPLLKAFHEVTTDASEYTPAHLTIFTALGLLQNAVANANQYTPQSLTDAIYQRKNNYVFGLPLYYSDTSSTCSSSDELGMRPCSSRRSSGSMNMQLFSLEQAVEGTNTIPLQYPISFSTASSTIRPIIQPHGLTSSTTTTTTTTTTTSSPYGPSNSPDGSGEPSFLPFTTSTSSPEGGIGAIERWLDSSSLPLWLMIAACALFLLLLLLLLLLYCCVWKTSYVPRPVLSDDIPMTCVCFSFENEVNHVFQREGRKRAEDVCRRMNSLVQNAISRHGINIIENTGCMIVGMTSNSWSAVQACIDVKKGYHTLKCTLDSEESSKSENSFTATSPYFDEKSDPSLIENNKRRKGIGMGISTSLITCNERKEHKEVVLYSGPCLYIAKRLAREMWATSDSENSILAHSTTYYALSEYEGNQVDADGPYGGLYAECGRKYLKGYTNGSHKNKTPHSTKKCPSISGDQEEVYIIHGMVGNDDMRTGDRIVVLHPHRILNMCLSRVHPVQTRIPLLLSLCQSRSIAVPPRELYSDEEYAAKLLQMLE